MADAEAAGRDAGASAATYVLTPGTSAAAAAAVAACPAQVAYSVGSVICGIAVLVAAVAVRGRPRETLLARARSPKTGLSPARPLAATRRWA